MITLLVSNNFVMATTVFFVLLTTITTTNQNFSCNAFQVETTSFSGRRYHPRKTDTVNVFFLQKSNTRYLVGSGLSSLSSSSSSSTSDEEVVNYDRLSIEYCTGCRWQLRSFWMAQELLTTFIGEKNFNAITLIPSRPPSPGGTFQIKCYGSNNNKNEDETLVLWDRNENGGFPEIKQLKQLIRDTMVPNKYLGHSDSTDKKQQQHDQQDQIPAAAEEEESKVTDNNPTTVLSKILEQASNNNDDDTSSSIKPNIAIIYCTGCKWLLRAAWFGQELLTTFTDEVHSLSLIPSKPSNTTPAATFTILLNGNIIWDRAEQKGFPQIKELKQMIRDQINPNKHLGHSDVANNKNDVINIDSTMDDDEAEEARKFFGVL